MDGGNDADTDTVNITGAGSYLVSVSDSGASGTDTLAINGAQADKFLLRASKNASGVAFVAALHGDPVADVERVNYNRSIENLVIDMGDGDDSATLDDTWAIATISGGKGQDHFQVGQIFKSARDALAGVAPADVFQTILTTRGYLSNGNGRLSPSVGYNTTINGDDGNDDFVVFRNTAKLQLNGNAGDDNFTVRASRKTAPPTPTSAAARTLISSSTSSTPSSMSMAARALIRYGSSAPSSPTASSSPIPASSAPA